LETAEERTSKEKKFALDLAHQSAKLAEESAIQMEVASETDAGESKDGKDGKNDKNAKQEIDGWLAGHLATLAWAQHHNGDQKQAIATMQRCLKLYEKDAYRAALAKFQK
jgi:hypothetical protein